jgi:hypothetical protein
MEIYSLGARRWKNIHLACTDVAGGWLIAVEKYVAVCVN